MAIKDDHDTGGETEGGITSSYAANDGVKREFTMLCKRLDLAKSKLLYKFDSFNPKDWSIVKGTPKWTVTVKKIRGGSPDEPTHGQIFFK